MKSRSQRRNLILSPCLNNLLEPGKITSVWALGTGWSLNAGFATGITAAGNLTFDDIAPEDGAIYRWTIHIPTYSSGNVRFAYTGGGSGSLINSAGWHTQDLLNDGGTTNFLIQTPSDFTGSLSHIEIRKVQSA